MSEELQRLNSDGEAALGELFAQYRDRLERAVEFRMDARLRGRIDPVDVLQEAYLRVARRLDGYLENPEVSVYVWLRVQTCQALSDVQRRHAWEKRNPRNEVQIRQKKGGSSYTIADAMFDELTSPSQAAVRAEEIDQLHEALATMDEIDREVLALRHFEHLSNSEVAETLSLSPTAASNRYVRAMTRLSEMMAQTAAEDQ